MESYMGVLGFLFVLLFLLGCIGLINPRWVRMPSRKRSSMIFFGTSFLLPFSIAILLQIAGVLPEKGLEQAKVQNNQNISSTEQNTESSAADTAKFSGKFDFKGVTLGMSEAEVKKIIPGLSRYQYGTKTSKNFTLLGCETRWKDDDEGCRVTISNQRVKDAEFHFMNNKLGKVKIDFDKDYFSTVIEGLTTKFGQPLLQEDTDLVRSYNGVSTKSQSLTWVATDDHTLLAIDHITDGDNYIAQGRLVIYESQYLQAIDADQVQLGKKTDQADL